MVRKKEPKSIPTIKKNNIKVKSVKDGLGLIKSGAPAQTENIYRSRMFW